MTDECTRGRETCDDCGRPKCRRCGRCKDRYPEHRGSTWTYECPSRYCRFRKAVRRQLLGRPPLRPVDTECFERRRGDDCEETDDRYCAHCHAYYFS